ncbi:hypothetical protein [Pelagicoccus sp. SDUM812002]|uniref:hypothetical protein n=1 Tax=Pelagicoccus sp. SDUM812002 TaxID=3041266 RepID=UPI00280E133C|nr:hypothetical protein [Pelagicoccus sp. SDUM812002]MDQ8185763.1 hypothetical protein [Pelagicoccus sp. SDUM812002]
MLTSQFHSNLVDLENCGCGDVATYERKALKAKYNPKASKRIRIANQKRSLPVLRDSLLLPLCITKKDLFTNNKELQAFAQKLHVDTEEYEDRRDFEKEVHKHFDLFKYLRRNRALFRTLGCYMVRRASIFPTPSDEIFSSPPSRSLKNIQEAKRKDHHLRPKRLCCRLARLEGVTALLGA